MPLQDPPVLQHLFLESPWPIMVALLVVALGVAIAGTRRASGRLQLAALLLVLLAGGAYLLAALVQTDREHVMSATRDLVQATAPLDLDRVSELLAPQAVFTGPQGQTWMTYAELEPLLERTLGRWGVREQTIRAMAGEATSQSARTTIDLRTTIDQTGLPMPTAWMIGWERQADGSWRAVEVRWLTIQDQPPSEGMWR